MLRRRRSVLEAVHRAGDRIGEEPRLGHDRGGLRRRQRNLDHFDAVERAVRVRGACVDAAGHLGRGANAAGPGHVDVEVVGVVRALQQRVRMRAATRLHRRDLDGRVEVRDVEDPHAAEAQRVAGRDLRGAAVGARPGLLGGHEEQVPVHRDLALAARADDRGADLRIGGIGDVVDLEAVEVADERVVTLEREIGVDEGEAARVRRVEEAGGLGAVREQFEAVRGDAGVVEAGREADPRVGGRLGGCDCRDDRGCQEGAEHRAERASAVDDDTATSIMDPSFRALDRFSDTNIASWCGSTGSRHCLSSSGSRLRSAGCSGGDDDAQPARRRRTSSSRARQASRHARSRPKRSRRSSRRSTRPQTSASCRG